MTTETATIQQKAGPKLRQPAAIENGGRSIILAAFGRLGTDLGRLLISAGPKPVTRDHNEENVRVLRRFGFEAYYGDATRHDLLESAGATEAELIVITFGEHEKSILSFSSRPHRHQDRDLPKPQLSHSG